MKQFIFFLSFIFIALFSYAQIPGSNNPTFNPVDSGYGYEADAQVFAAVVVSTPLIRGRFPLFGHLWSDEWRE